MWKVVFTKHRALRVAGSGGGVTSVRVFHDEVDAWAFYKECKKAKFRVSKPVKKLQLAS
jgi:hypothetical protein